ncbi:hypothetical protein ACS0TY_030402 [Phlomoides rotata]
MLAIWSEITAESSLDMAELENASPIEADKWFLSPCLSQNLDISDGSIIGFASQLNLLVKALEMPSEAKFIEDFVSGSETLKSSAIVPPPTVLDRVLKDLFHEGTQLFLIYYSFNNILLILKHVSNPPSIVLADGGSIKKLYI